MSDETHLCEGKWAQLFQAWGVGGGKDYLLGGGQLAEQLRYSTGFGLLSGHYAQLSRNHSTAPVWTEQPLNEKRPQHKKDWIAVCRGRS